MNDTTPDAPESGPETEEKAGESRRARSIRFSDSEWEAIEKAAAERGMSAAEFARHAALGVANSQYRADDSALPPQYADLIRVAAAESHERSHPFPVKLAAPTGQETLVRLSVPSCVPDVRDRSGESGMAQGRLPMGKVKKVPGFHFGEGRSARAIAMHCGIARRSVSQTLERFAASGLSRPCIAGRGPRTGRRWTASGRSSRASCSCCAVRPSSRWKR